MAKYEEIFEPRDLASLAELEVDVAACLTSPDSYLVKNAIRTSAEQICTEYQVWRGWSFFTRIKPGATMAYFSFEQDAKVLSVNELIVTKTKSGSGTPKRNTVENLNGVNLSRVTVETMYPLSISFHESLFAHGETDEVWVAARATLSPRVDANVLPQWFVMRYRSVIVDRALAKLYAMRARPWHDPDSASVRMQDFERGIERLIAIDAANGGKQHEQSVAKRGVNHWSF